MADPIQVSNEPWVQRLSSHSTAAMDTRFEHEIRARDRKCVVSSRSNSEIHIQLEIWAGFDATYIIPPEHESLWIQSDNGQWIKNMDNVTGSLKINSAQNGFLLNSAAHEMFNQYLLAVNPDDGYKIVVFCPDPFGNDGKILDPVCRNPADPNSVSDQLLRWHFRQSVLANMRGVGEPIFEHDFPPGTDMMDEILAGPNGKQRFEFEMASRLRGGCLKVIILRTGGWPSYSYSVTNRLATRILRRPRDAYRGGGGDVLRWKTGRDIWQ